MKQGWEIKTIGSICDIKTGKLDANAASENGAYPFFTCSQTPLRIDNYAYDCECVLVAGNGELNAKYYKGKFNAYQRTYIITTKLEYKDISVKYLYKFFSKYIEQLRQLSIGGVIKYIKLGNLTDAKLPVPSREEQERIVEELNCLSGIIERKCEQLRELDALAQSIFYQMFGDPITNEKGWEVKKLGEVANSVNYGTSSPATEGGYYTYIRMNNLTYSGYLDLSDVKKIDISENEMEKCIVRKGDILFNRTNSKDLVGKTALFDLDEEMIIAGYIIRVRANTDVVLPIYVVRYMNTPFMKTYFRNLCKGAVNQANINSKELKAIPILMPHIELQQEYAEKIEAIEKQKELIKQSIAETEELFNSRMSYYFN